ncbi:MAG TPA: putative quinol monooxygenase [Bauldia sp.]|nr:putative quinol monooxygenase [Bauldia sp.]
MTRSFAVVVAFVVHNEFRDEFLALVSTNAAASVREERGCRRFDVVLPEAPDTIYLYEIYDDRASFDAHLASDHFRRFDEATRSMIAAKTVTVGPVLEHYTSEPR